MLDYNTENPIVRDELWDDCDAEPDYTEIVIDYSPLDIQTADKFFEDVDKLVMQFDDRVNLFWRDGFTELVVGCQMYEDEKEGLISLCESYGLDYDEE